MLSIFHDNIQQPKVNMQSLNVQKWQWRVFLRQDWLNYRRGCCYIKAWRSLMGPCVLLVRWSSLAISLPLLVSQGAEGIAEQNSVRLRIVWKPVRYFWLSLIALSTPAFRFQVLGTKYKHELLVDHPFSNSAGSRGNFNLILPLFDNLLLNKLFGQRQV